MRAGDEVTRRLVEVREAAETRMLAIVAQKEAKLAQDRAELGGAA